MILLTPNGCQMIQIQATVLKTDSLNMPHSHSVLLPALSVGTDDGLGSVIEDLDLDPDPH